MSINTAQSLYELVGAPLMALVDAESQAAKATANFIKEMGFKEASRADEQASVEEFGRQVDFGDLRMVKFRSQRRQADGRERDYRYQHVPDLQRKDTKRDMQ